MIFPRIIVVASSLLVLSSMSSSSSSSSRPKATPCDGCRKYCLEMRKKTHMKDVVVCDNEGVTWKNNCDFIHRQCLALAEGKLLMVVGEGDCTTPIDDVGKIGAVGGLQKVGKVGKIGKVDKIEATIPTVGNIGDVGDLKVTVGPIDTIDKLEDVAAVEDVVEVDDVPKIPNKRPPIPTPKQPGTPSPLDAHPRTLIPPLDDANKGKNGNGTVKDDMNDGKNGTVKEFIRKRLSKD